MSKDKFVLCCDCQDYLPVACIGGNGTCSKFMTSVRDKTKQGCTEGKEKPKMYEINGREFPKPVSEGGYYRVDIRYWQDRSGNCSDSKAYRYNSEQDARAMYDAIVKAVQDCE